MSFDDLLRHTLVVKRLVATTAGGAETVGGADTTLTADVLAGSLTLTVASAVGVSAGNWLRIGDSGETEIRQVAVGGVAGLVVTLTAPLALSHDSGDQVREVDDAGTTTLDDYGQPVTAETTLATVDGLVQLRSARLSREVPLTSQGGAVISSHIGFLYPLAGLGTDCWIELEGVRYDVVGMPDAAGQGHHLELALQAVS